MLDSDELANAMIDENLAACQSDPDLRIIATRLCHIGGRCDLSHGFVRLNAYIIIVMGLLHLKGYILRNNDEVFAIGDAKSSRDLPLHEVLMFLHRDTKLTSLCPRYRKTFTTYCTWIQSLKHFYDRSCVREYLGETDRANKVILRYMFEFEDPPHHHSQFARDISLSSHDLLYTPTSFSFIITKLDRSCLLAR
jgi:hypothetical protein